METELAFAVPMTHLPRSIVVIIALLTALTAMPAVAASQYGLGAMVDYPLVFPVDGDHHFSDWFWSARSGGIHHAQDLMADKMTPVVAAAAGTVRLVNWTDKSHMNPDRCCTIALRHDDGWESWYIHLNNDTPGTDDGKAWGIAKGIVPGVRVKAGQLIGWVGDSGNAENTAPHVHFELRTPQKVIVNPFQALVDAGGNSGGSTPADPLFSGYRVLKTGTRGDDVRRLQEVLTDLGYGPGPLDGIAGPLTIAAVTEFQTDEGLTTDGLVGSVTRVALKEASEREPPPVVSTGILRKGSRGDDVRRVQDLLATAGHSPGPIDGIFGIKTESAVLAYQKERGLRVDGLVGPNTRSSLGF